MNTKVGINGDIYVIGTADNTTYLLKYNKYGTFTSSTVLATISTQRTGGSSITVNDVEIDNADNIYITGNSKSSLGSNGPGASFGTFQTIQGFFVAKYNASGVAQWAKSSSMLQTTSGNSISVASDGSVYVIGDFSGEGLSLGSHSPVNSIGKNDIFVVKYSQSGVFTWISTIGGTENDSGKGIVTSSNGDVYLAGYSADLLSLKFNKSASVLGSKFGGNDILIMKLDRSSGVPSWIRTAGGSGSDIANSIGIDENSNLYCTGTASSTAFFNNTSVGVSGLNSLFLTKYNLSGDVIWATSGSSTGFTITSDQVIVDATGNVFLKGVFVNDLTIKTLSKKSSNNNFDGYVAKFSNGGDIQWLESIGGTGNDYTNGIVFDNNKNIFATIYSDAGFMLGGTNYPANSYLWRLDK